MEGNVMPWVPCQVVRGGRRRRTQLGPRCSQVIVLHAGQLSGVAFDVYVPLSAPSRRPRRRRNAAARLSVPLPPTPTREGTDTTLCPKKAVITGWMGDCYISARQPIGQRGPADARFQTSTSRIELQRRLSQKHRHFSTSDANRKTGE